MILYIIIIGIFKFLFLLTSSPPRHPPLRRSPPMLHRPQQPRLCRRPATRYWPPRTFQQSWKLRTLSQGERGRTPPTRRPHHLTSTPTKTPNRVWHRTLFCRMQRIYLILLRNQFPRTQSPSQNHRPYLNPHTPPLSPRHHLPVTPHDPTES